MISHLLSIMAIWHNWDSVIVMLLEGHYLFQLTIMPVIFINFVKWF